MISEFIDEYSKELNDINKTHQMSLNVTKDEFFDDGVKKYIDHDLLHEMFAHEDEPIYKKTQSDQAEVFCSESLWNQLTYEQQINMVLEETYVIAAERFIIPKMVFQRQQLELLHDRDAFDGDPGNLHMQTILNSLKKVCTSLSSGWFREFSINNYFEICNNIDIEYFREICSKIHEDGTIYK